MPYVRKTEKCFFCNKRYAPELGRILDIIQTSTERKKVKGDIVEKETSKKIGRAFVCFQCEVPCSTPPEFNADGSIKQKDRGF